MWRGTLSLKIDHHECTNVVSRTLVHKDVYMPPYLNKKCLQKFIFGLFHFTGSSLRLLLYYLQK